MTTEQTQPMHDLPRTDAKAKTVKVYIENRKNSRNRPVKRVKCVQVVDFYRGAPCA